MRSLPPNRIICMRMDNVDILRERRVSIWWYVTNMRTFSNVFLHTNSFETLGFAFWSVWRSCFKLDCIRCSSSWIGQLLCCSSFLQYQRLLKILLSLVASIVDPIGEWVRSITSRFFSVWPILWHWALQSTIDSARVSMTTTIADLHISWLRSVEVRTLSNSSSATRVVNSSDSEIASSVRWLPLRPDPVEGQLLLLSISSFSPSSSSSSSSLETSSFTLDWVGERFASSILAFTSHRSWVSLLERDVIQLGIAQKWMHLHLSMIFLPNWYLVTCLHELKEVKSPVKKCEEFEIRDLRYRVEWEEVHHVHPDLHSERRQSWLECIPGDQMHWWHRASPLFLSIWWGWTDHQTHKLKGKSSGQVNLVCKHTEHGSNGPVSSHSGMTDKLCLPLSHWHLLITLFIWLMSPPHENPHPHHESREGKIDTFLHPVTCSFTTLGPFVSFLLPFARWMFFLSVLSLSHSPLSILSISLRSLFNFLFPRNRFHVI